MKTAMTAELVAEVIYRKACERGGDPAKDRGGNLLSPDEKWAAATVAWALFRKWYGSSRKGSKWSEVCASFDDKVRSRHYADEGVSIMDDYCDSFEFVWPVLVAMGAVWEDEDPDAEYVLHGNTDYISDVLTIINGPGFERR